MVNNCKCVTCGKAFHAIPSYIKRGPVKYCSRKCMGMNRRHNIKKVCLICGKIIILQKNQFKGEAGKYCSYKCYHRALKDLMKNNKYFGSKKDWSGKNSSSWLGGKSFNIYPKEFDNYLKEKIRERDRYRCQICGVPQIECNGRLHIHHINYKKTDCNINNLISLCRPCHSKTRVNRMFWTETLKEKTCLK